MVGGIYLYIYMAPHTNKQTYFSIIMNLDSERTLSLLAGITLPDMSDIELDIMCNEIAILCNDARIDLLTKQIENIQQRKGDNMMMMQDEAIEYINQHIKQIEQARAIGISEDKIQGALAGMCLMVMLVYSIPEHELMEHLEAIVNMELNNQTTR